ncbi:CHAT domain-containing protein [Paraburkholderia nemoris]|uniref:CHAT domain-containing protein n=1 Tax=Paraburkholderia nemoris TaxID=2793076 RepID=UPI0038B85477
MFSKQYLEGDEMAGQDASRGHAVEGFDPRQLFSKGFNFDCIDLLQGGSFREAVGRTVVTLLLGATDKENGRLPFSGVSVVLPPAMATSLTSDAVLHALVSETKAMRGSEPDAEEIQVLKRLVRVINCSTLQVDDLAAVVAGEGKKRLVAVAEASKYRDQSIVRPPIFGVSAVWTSEDSWAPHVSSLCRQCVSAVKSTGSYAVVHVSESPAERPGNVEQLLSVGDCFVATLHYERDPEEIVNRRAQTWLSMALSGALADALKEVDELQLTAVARLHLEAQLLHRIGKDHEALDCIEEMRPYLPTLTPAQLVQLSRLAHKAGDDSLAQDLLVADADGISEEMWLEEGLELAMFLEDNDRVESFDARLAKLYPHSDRLKENRDRRLLLNCLETNRHSGHVFTTAGLSERHLALLSGVSSPQRDYNKLIEQARAWGREWLDLAVICCAMHARSIGQLRDSADIASLVTTRKLYGRQATQIVLSSVRAMMLKEEVIREERDYYRAPLLAAIRHIAQHPADGALRAVLSTLLSVDSCGDLGIPIVAVIMLDIAGEGVRVSPPATKTAGSGANVANNNEEPDEETITGTIKSALLWLGDQGAAEFGVTVLPAGLVGRHPDRVVQYLSRIILRICAQLGEDVDLAYMERMVLLACAMCPHATEERDEDLRVMRLFASQCAMAGQFQRARNVAEQILLMGQGNDVRQRLAWLAFADVYHRCRNYVEALVGLACALTTDVAVDKADLWQEVYLGVRVLRDLGLFAVARKFLPTLKQLLSDLGFDATTDVRIVSTELALRLLEVEDSDRGEIAALVDEVACCCERALTRRNELLPLVALLAQAMQKAETAGILVNTQTRDLFAKAVVLIGEQAAQMVMTISSVTPSAADVADMFNKVQRALYAADAPGDYAAVGLAARRLLDSDLEEDPKDDVKALAVELLADHAVALSSTPAEITTDWPVSYAQLLHQEGLNVAFLAVDSAGELVVTYVSNGRAQSIEQPRHDQPFRQRMLAWLEDYPRNYGYVDAANGNNDFFTTMEKLDVRLPAPHSLLIVAEPLLQQLPANLVLVEPDDGGFSYFLGSKTAVGMVPSLTWLSIAKSRARGGRQLYKAWISAHDGPEAEGVLDVALARLRGTFDSFGFVVDTGRNLPRDLSDARLAVVTAHGGLTAEGRYIHSIRDEGTLIEAPAALAAALAGIEVVILFVCSGGRLDKHPWDNTTVGLPKQLLHKGCRAVIASPWPLDVKVTYRWLEPFLSEWEAGATLLQATKKANEAVAQALGDGPQYFLAMTVYGDLLLTK